MVSEPGCTPPLSGAAIFLTVRHCKEVTAKKFRTALVAAAATAIITATIMVSTGLSAQTLGIAARDDFLEKYETCVTSQVGAARRATFQGQFDQGRKAWSDTAKDPNTRQASRTVASKAPSR